MQSLLEGEERYQRLALVGEGTYGLVYKALDLATGEVVALKKIRLEHEEEGIPATAVREISLLQVVQHANVIKVKDVVLDDARLYIVYEFVEQDLRTFLDARERLDVPAARRLAFQLLAAVGACHGCRVLHRDVKPQNLLVGADRQLKLIDFGLARMFSVPDKTYTHEVVTLWYRAPEVLLGCRRYLTAVDVWSVGCVFGELLAGRPLFQGDSEIDQLFRIFRLLGTPDCREWPELAGLEHFKTTWPVWRPAGLATLFPELDAAGLELLGGLLAYDPRRRLTCEEALAHVVFV